MQKTRIPASANAPTRFHGWPAAIRATPLLGALVLAALPAAVQGQTLNNTGTRFANPVVVVQPTLRQINPTRTLNATALRPLAPSTARIAPTLSRTLTPTANPTTRITGIAPSVAATGLGRLVAPGAENASAMVARVGTTTRADISNLTLDFDGDGLINFEIARGIVEIPPTTAGRSDDPLGGLGGLVGQHITVATGTADRVLDSVINTAGVIRATTFSIDNGTVVLGGFQPQDLAGVVDVITPSGPATHDPEGAGGRDPNRQPRPRGEENTTGDQVGGEGRQSVEYCTSAGCFTLGTPEPKPGTDPGAEPDLSGVFNFTGFRRLPTPESSQDAGMGDLVDVSIMLPLRGREREGDQFSNHGNEEIW